MNVVLVSLVAEGRGATLVAVLALAAALLSAVATICARQGLRGSDPYRRRAALDERWALGLSPVADCMAAHLSYVLRDRCDHQEDWTRRHGSRARNVHQHDGRRVAFSAMMLASGHRGIYACRGRPLIHFVFAGLAENTGVLLTIVALTLGAVSVVIPLTAAMPIFVLILSHFFLKGVEVITCGSWRGRC